MNVAIKVNAAFEILIFWNYGFLLFMEVYARNNQKRWEMKLVRRVN